MRSDLTALDGRELDVDVCVVGAGAAGLTLARELIGTPLRVALVDSGGLRVDPAVEALNVGDSTGVATVDLEASRARGFGGTTRLWAGQCVRFEREDFEERPWVSHSGWPFSRTELEPFYARAERLLGVQGIDSSESMWSHFGLSIPPLDPTRLRHRFTVLPKRVDLGRLMLREFDRAHNVHVILGATAVEVRLRDDGRVAGIELRSPGGKTGRVRAARVVLCAGGIENPRLLLSSRRQRPAGLGNEHDLVGRFFQEHPNQFAAHVLGADVDYLQDRYGLLYRRGLRWLPRFSLSPEAQEKHATVQAAAVLVFEHREGSGVSAARELVRGARRRESPRRLAHSVAGIVRDAPALPDVLWRRYVRGLSPGGRPERVRLQVFTEQAPDPTSRVMLTDQPDAVGMPRVRTCWQLGRAEADAARAIVDEVRCEFARLGLGRVIADDWVTEGRVSALRDAYHHAGTTRMARDPRKGVIDPQGQAHGVPGLFVASSSAFPTSSWANPVLTSMAMSIRLADHLRRGAR